MNKPSQGNDFTLSCPIPITGYERILLAHGGGGKLSAALVQKIFVPAFSNEHLDRLHDGAFLPIGNSRIAFSTDSFVVNPVFFPGGNIGDLAVNGTVNDLACCGAKPLYLSLALILEEGLEMEKLRMIIRSARLAAEKAGVTIVTGDTKVVERGKGDQVFINTSGIGIIPEGVAIDPASCRPGDQVIISGTIAEHGVAILSARAGLGFTTSIRSDTAPLNGLTESILLRAKSIRVFRDPTRGGLASTLNELSASSGYQIRIHEDRIPVREEVTAACEILGLDPLYMANEGKLIVITPPDSAGEVLETMRAHPGGKNAAIIGEVTPEKRTMVQIVTSLGTSRVVDMISGEQLPRIC